MFLHLFISKNVISTKKSLSPTTPEQLEYSIE